MFHHIQKTKLFNHSDFLVVVHSFAHYRLNAIERSIFIFLSIIVRLQRLHAMLCQSFELRQLIPINKLSKNVQHIFNFIFLKVTLITQHCVLEHF